MSWNSVVRHVLERGGYYVRHRSVVPFGVDYFNDIERLAGLWKLPIRIFFDVGAHCGETSRAALSHFSDAIVFAFEPCSKTFAMLCNVIKGNERFSPHKIALSDRLEDAKFFEYECSLYNSLAPNPYAKQSAKVEIVPCTTVDAFCEQHGIDAIDVLKIDAERCDLLVLKGAQNMLTLGRIRFVFFEFYTLADGDGSLWQIARRLTSLGFRFVATYIDQFDPDHEFMVANALFVLPLSGEQLGSTAPS